MVLFLQVYKILGSTTPLLCVWKSHIWGLLVCHEWLWGIRANAVAWDPSYNNTDSFEGPTITAKTTAWALPAAYTSNIKHAAGDRCCVYRPTCLAVCQEQLWDARSLLWHQCVRGRQVDLCRPVKERHHTKAALRACAFLLYLERPITQSEAWSNLPHVPSVLHDFQCVPLVLNFHLHRDLFYRVPQLLVKRYLC